VKGNWDHFKVKAAASGFVRLSKHPSAFHTQPSTHHEFRMTHTANVAYAIRLHDNLRRAP
jgi:hypothetical protein